MYIQYMYIYTTIQTKHQLDLKKETTVLYLFFSIFKVHLTEMQPMPCLNYAVKHVV